MTEQKPNFDRTRSRPAVVPKLGPGIRVRYNSGQWESDSRGDYYFVTNWAALPWAYTLTGVTITDLEAQGGVDWQRLGCHAWCVPEYATGIKLDRGGTTWVRTSCLDVVGYAESAPSEAGEIQQELFK